MLRLRERWRKYRNDLPEAYGGNSKGSRRPELVWADHELLLSGYWSAVVSSRLGTAAAKMMDILTRLTSSRRRELLEPGGPIVTQRRTKRRWSNSRHPIPPAPESTLPEHIEITQRELDILRHPRGYYNPLKHALFRLGVLQSVGKHLSGDQVAVLALSGVLLGGWDIGEVKQPGQHSKDRPRKVVWKDGFGSGVVKAVRCITHSFSGGMLFVRLSRAVYGWEEVHVADTCRPG
jgi:hypothetical protein